MGLDCPELATELLTVVEEPAVLGLILVGIMPIEPPSPAVELVVGLDVAVVPAAAAL